MRHISSLTLKAAVGFAVCLCIYVCAHLSSFAAFYKFDLTAARKPLHRVPLLAQQPRVYLISAAPKHPIQFLLLIDASAL